jgi:hypothetical protein
VQAAHGDHGPPGRTRRQRGVFGIPGAQAGQVVGDVRGGDVFDFGLASRA